MAMPKSRCGATQSSIRVESPIWSNGAAARGQLRQLGQDVATALGLFAQGLEFPSQRVVGVEGFSISREMRKMVASGVPSSWAAAAARAIELGQMLLARQHQLGGGESASESLLASSVTWKV